jgi:hypothetical protein
MRKKRKKRRIFDERAYCGLRRNSHDVADAVVHDTVECWNFTG